MTTRLDRIELAAQRTLLDVSGYHVIEDIRALIAVARAARDLQAVCELPDALRKESIDECLCVLFSKLATLLEEVK